MDLDQSLVHISPATLVSPGKHRSRGFKQLCQNPSLWQFGSNNSRKHKSVWHYSRNESSSQWRSRCDFNHISNRQAVWRQMGLWLSKGSQLQDGRCCCKAGEADATVMGVGLQQDLQQQQMLQLPQTSGQPVFKMQLQVLFAPEFLVVTTCWMGTSAFTFTQ